MFSKISKKIFQHKLISVIILILIVAGAYFGYKTLFKSSSATRYVLGTAEKGTLIVSVSGSGEVSALSQIDAKPKVSGDIVYVGVKNGDEVKMGTLLFKIDDKKAQNDLTNAAMATNIEKKQLNFENLKKSDNASEVFSAITETFSDLPAIISDLDDILNHYSYLSNNRIKKYDETTRKYKIESIKEYKQALDMYNKNLKDYHTINRGSSIKSMASVLDETSNTLKTVGEAARDTNILLNKVDHFVDSDSLIEHQDDLNADVVKINSHLSSLITARQSVESASLDVQSQELALKKQQDELFYAKEDLDDYSVKALFDAEVAKVNFKKGEAVSPTDIIATLITKEKIAEITLNEVDVVQVKIGQKATLTFDAIPNLSISGQVVEVDSIGTVSQGVVSYNVKISFDTQDERIKPTMSVSAVIITEAKQNVLLVPASAVKSQGNTSYVEVVKGETPDSTASTTGVILKNSPIEQTVEIGLSNDESTEIISGLNEGDRIVIRTIQSNSTATSSQTGQQGGGLRIPGLTGGASGGRRND